LSVEARKPRVDALADKHQGRNLKSLDDMPYVLIGTILATVGFFVGNLFFYRYNWQLIVAPVIGAILGFAAGVLVLQGRKLHFSTTLGEFKAAMKRQNEEH
jgi:hypothetical protein